MTSERDMAIASLAGQNAIPRMDSDTARELVEFFLSELNQSMGRIDTAWRQGDKAMLQYIAHELRGAAAGFGFPRITESAAMLEEALLEEEAALSDAAEQMESLLHVCREAAQIDK